MNGEGEGVRSRAESRYGVGGGGCIKLKTARYNKSRSGAGDTFIAKSAYLALESQFVALEANEVIEPGERCGSHFKVFFVFVFVLLFVCLSSE